MRLANWITICILMCLLGTDAHASSVNKIVKQLRAQIESKAPCNNDNGAMETVALIEKLSAPQVQSLTRRIYERYKSSFIKRYSASISIHCALMRNPKLCEAYTRRCFRRPHTADVLILSNLILVSDNVETARLAKELATTQDSSFAAWIRHSATSFYGVKFDVRP